MSSIAILNRCLPSLPSEPGSPRLFHLAQEWSKHHELVLIVLSASQAIPPELAAIFKRIIFIPGHSEFGVLGKLRHRLHNAPHFYQGYRCPTFVAERRSAIASVLREYDVRHLHVNLIVNAEFVPEQFPPSRVSVDVRDAPSLLYRREAALARNSAKKIDLLLEARSTTQYLKTLDRLGYQLIVVAQADADALYSEARIQSIVVPNGVDAEYFGEQMPLRPDRQIAVFTGVMNYPPNIETAVRFAKEFFPELRQRHPNLEFYIVGSDPVAEVRALKEESGIVVTGRVPDIRPYLAMARVFVCPMHSGSGIKNKVLAAMAAGVPVVATPLGIAGIAASSELHCFVRESRESFIDCVDDILSARIRTETLVRDAREFVEQQYEWRARAEELLAHWELLPEPGHATIADLQSAAKDFPSEHPFRAE